jgi:site-specific DNA recombinase
MWMGGTVPLGYDVKDRKLMVNESEASTVVDIFRRYLRLKSVRTLAEELATAGIRSKCRYHPDGTEYGNQRFSHGALYLMLQNRTYRGEATHKGNAYPGEHSAIVEQSLWDAVQVVLAENRVARANGANTKQPSLLSGMIFDEAGDRLTPTWSVKKGTRYRYYVSSSLVTGRVQTQASGRRIPAGNLERVVIDRLRSFFANQGEVLDAIGGEGDEHVGHRQLIDGAKRITGKLDGDGSETTKAILKSLVRRVEVAPDCVKIDICGRDLVEVLSAPSIDLTIKDRGPTHPSEGVITLTVPVKLKRAGREMKMLVDDPGDRASIDISLLRIVARAHDIQARLTQNTNLTVHDIAREEQVTAAYVYILLRLPWLAPDITTAIVNGRQPPQLNAKKLMRLTAHLPADWAKQRVLLGFRIERVSDS